MRAALSVLALIILGLIWIFDVAALFRGEPRETVSVVIRDWSQRYPVIPFLAGCITGHIFWP